MKKRRWNKNTAIIIVVFYLLVSFCPAFGVLSADGLHPSSPGGQPLQQQAQKGLNMVISLDLRNMNIQDVFKFLATRGDLNMVTSRNVTGKATLALKDVTIKDALEIILLSNQLAYVEMGDIIYIMTESEFEATYGRKFMDNLKVKMLRIQYARPSYVFSVLSNIKSTLGKVILDEETGSIMVVDTPSKIEQMENILTQLEYRLDMKIFSMQYANVNDIESKLRSRLDAKAVGTIQADARTRQLIVSALPERMGEIERLIRKLDKPTKEVLIEARIMSISISPKYEMGIDWEKVFGRLNLKSAFPSTAATNVGTIAFGSLEGDAKFVGTLKALYQVSDVKLLANPRIAVIDGQPAHIHIGDKLAYTTSTTTAGTATTSTAESVTFVDVGIKLDVIPVINDDGYITISIKPEISSKSGEFTSESTGNIFPLINTTIAETSVIVKDGTTIIIGGLRKDERTRTVSGVPLLMNIPLLGKLFRSETDEITKQEIAIFLTPHIISPSVDLIEDDMEIKPFKESKEDVYSHMLNLMESRSQPVTQ